MNMKKKDSKTKDTKSAQGAESCACLLAHMILWSWVLEDKSRNVQGFMILWCLDHILEAEQVVKQENLMFRFKVWKHFLV